jgi:hypothetical protein
MIVIRNPKHTPKAGDRLLKNGCCRLVVSVEVELSTVRAVRWVNGHQYKALAAVPEWAHDAANTSTAGAWRAWAKDGATVLSEVQVA